MLDAMKAVWRGWKAVAHRIILKPEHQIKGLEADEVISTILREVPVPAA